MGFFKGDRSRSATSKGKLQYLMAALSPPTPNVKE
jgi:hypothetical protein